LQPLGILTPEKKIKMLLVRRKEMTIRRALIVTVLVESICKYEVREIIKDTGSCKSW
jgi:hypothetical protein